MLSHGVAGVKGHRYVIRVNDASLDSILGHIKRWYYDRYPNLEGDHLIAQETVKFLPSIPLQKNRTVPVKSE